MAYSIIISSVQLKYKMDAIFINSENNKIYHPHRILLNLTDKVSLKSREKYIALSNLSICDTWEKSQKVIQQNIHGSWITTLIISNKNNRRYPCPKIRKSKYQALLLTHYYYLSIYSYEKENYT